jgi:hypothetical protein
MKVFGEMVFGTLLRRNGEKLFSPLSRKLPEGKLADYY